MIKRLFLLAALLAPQLAYGANPSANLSVQIVPSVSTPAVPAAAAAAGFTTLAANYDFTIPGGTYSNPATYIDCKGAAVPQFYFTAPGIPGTVPCSGFSITTDPS